MFANAHKTDCSSVAVSMHDKKGQFLKKYYSKEFALLLEELGELFEKADKIFIYKDDAKTTTGIVDGKSHNLPFDFVVKRYNYENLVRYRLRTLIRDRARHSFLVSCQLLMMNLCVPDPIGYLKNDRLRKSFFLSKYLNSADNFARLFNEGKPHDPQDIALHLGRDMAQWHKAGAVHGDLKWSNILIQDIDGKYRFFFVDLDQTKLYPRPCTKGIRKDLVRFYRYGLELRASEWTDAHFFPAYLSHLDSKTIRINPDDIRDRARKDWERREQRKV